MGLTAVIDRPAEPLAPPVPPEPPEPDDPRGTSDDLDRLIDLPDDTLSRAKYREHAGHYDLASLAAVPLRSLAVSRLALRPGQTVVDVGCGTGLNFPAIQARIGPRGRLIGVDGCARMLARAGQRVTEQGWDNTSLVLAPAGAATLPTAIDAALFSLVHDVMRSPGALRHVLAHLRPGGRLSAAGSKLASPWAWWAPLLNPLVVQVNRPYITCLEGLARPWSHLAELVPDLSVTVDPWDVTYVAAGTWIPGRAG